MKPRTTVFAERLRRARVNRHLKQRELGERVSVSNLSISLYETGRNKPTLATLIKLAEALGLSTDYLLGLTADPSPYKQGGVEATGLSEG